MIEVSELVADPDFAQPFDLIRESVVLVEGESQVTPVAIPDMFGVIQPAKSEDFTEFAIEGQREGAWIAVWCAQEIRMGNGKDQLGDIIVWRGNHYRVAKAKHWETQGYYKVIANGYANG